VIRLGRPLPGKPDSLRIDTDGDAKDIRCPGGGTGRLRAWRRARSVEPGGTLEASRVLPGRQVGSCLEWRAGGRLSACSQQPTRGRTDREDEQREDYRPTPATPASYNRRRIRLAPAQYRWPRHLRRALQRSWPLRRFRQQRPRPLAEEVVDQHELGADRRQLSVAGERGSQRLRRCRTGEWSVISARAHPDSVTGAVAGDRALARPRRPTHMHWATERALFAGNFSQVDPAVAGIRRSMM